MILGYTTNGFALHRLEDAINILADIGYRSVAITLDHHFNPLDSDWRTRAVEIKNLLRQRMMACTVETGARFLLDPRRKHQPTLISAEAAGRESRLQFLCRAIDVARELDADCVSVWSGSSDGDASSPALFERLCDGLGQVLTYAEQHRIPVGFEPEPGMFIETMAQFERVFQAVGHPLLGLTMDIGHVHCLGDGDLYDHLKRWQDVLLNVHLEDMRHGKHEHLFFGEGEINFTEVINYLSAIEYRGPVHVELSRHSHDAPAAAERAYAFLAGLWPENDPPGARAERSPRRRNAGRIG